MFTNFAGNSLAPQTTMSSYLAQQMSMTSANSSSAQQKILNQAFGSNAMATGVGDAAQGQAILNAISGFTATGAPGYAQPLQAGAKNLNALLNYTNGTSMTQSSSLTNALMSPQVAMSLYRYGLGGISPLQIGGKVNTNSAQFFEGINSSRLMGGAGDNLNNLRYNLRAGGVGAANISQALGLTGSQLSQFETSDLDVAKLQSEGWSTSKINQTMQQASTGNKPAQETLNKAGIHLTDQQLQKNVTATQTSRQSDIEQGFSTGLQDATNNLTKFNDALNKIFKLPVIGNLLSAGSGFFAESKNQGSLLQSVLGGIGGVAGSIGSMLGGGAASPSATTQTKTAGSSSKNSNASGVPAQAVRAVQAAEREQGVPYQWGGEQPGVGFDCSGLVQWAYDQAGISLPRTSQAQWAMLKRRRVPLNKVQEGDIVFTAGSDGTASSPGHEGLMVNQKQVIQAPYTGQNVQVNAFDPANWLYAARPAGNLSGSASGGSTIGSTSSTTQTGNSGGAPAAESGGLGLDPGNYGSVDELQAVQGALLGGISVETPGGNTAGTTGSGTGTAGTAAGGASSSVQGGSTAANQAIAKGLMAGYGWTSAAEWTALDNLWARESGWSNTIWNGGSHAASGPPPGSSGAYGIAQALPYTKYPKTGQPPGSGGKADAGAQETWGLQYIKTRYQDPIGAWAHEQSMGWYATGTDNARQGYAVVGERGPELVKLQGGEQIFNANQTAHLAKQDAKQPMSHPYVSMLNSTFQLPESPAASSNPAAAAAGGAGGGVTLNFNENSINLGQGVSAQDAQNFVAAVERAMQSNATIQAVATGTLHG